MITSRTGLAVLAAIALALAALVVFEPHHAAEDRALAPGLDVAQLKELAWGKVHLVRDDRGWAWVDPPGRADRETVDAVLAALRGARWHRKRARTTATVTLAAGGATFGIGEHLAGSDQTWIVRDRDDVLVDDWVAHALAPEPVALRVHHPFANPPPLTVAYRPSPDFIKARELAYEAIEARAVPPCPPDLESVSSPTGDACVDRELWGRKQAIDRDQPLIDPRPVPFAPQRIELPDHHVIDVTKRPQLDGKDADPDHVAALIAALTYPRSIEPLPAGKPTGTLVVSAGKDTVTLDLYASAGVVVRRGEPSALRPNPGAWDALVAPSTFYATTTRWLEDPATISAVTIDGKTFHRGATLGEWTDTDKPAIVEGIATRLAMLQAQDGDPPAKIEHTIELTVTPPVGKPISHRLEVGANCAARADGAAVSLPIATCEEADAARFFSSRR